MTAIPTTIIDSSKARPFPAPEARKVSYRPGREGFRIDWCQETTQSSVLPVTGPLAPDLGLGNVCVSLPRLVDANGAGAILPLIATDEELAAIRASVAAVRATLAQVR